MAKRTLDTFFKPVSPPTKRPKPANPESQSNICTPESPSEPEQPPSTHPAYPIPIPQLPSHIHVALSHGTPARDPRTISNQPHLNLLHFQPYITRTTANELFKFLRQELPFYRVQYQIKRGGIDTQINTPRYTTVFGVDDTSRFVESNSSPKENTDPSDPTKREDLKEHSTELQRPQQSNISTPNTNDLILIDTQTKTPISKTKYTIPPRPIPPCLDHLRQTVEEATGARYNFCLVNYYASGEDSISFHSDDERFLGGQPNIASLSLGGEREFQMKHKPPPTLHKGFAHTGSSGVGNQNPGSSMGSTGMTGLKGDARPFPGSQSDWTRVKTHGQMQNPADMQTGSQAQIKMSLASGDMVVMRGETQSNWLHSIPKKRGRAGDGVRGRINITFRKAVVPAGTNNYYHYNVGAGPVYRWDAGRGVMDLMK